MITLFTNGHPLQEIGVKSLVGYLEFYNIPVRAFYLNKCNKLSEQAIEKIIKIVSDSSLVGFSLMSKDLNILFPLINAIKRQNIPVVVGGVHPTALPKESLEFADFVCVGEGEEPLRLLYKALMDKTNNFNIPNIGYKVAGKIIINPITYFNNSLDSLPFPDYVFKDSYILTNGKDEIKKIPILPEEKSRFFAGRDSFLFYSQRGCNFSCTYCSNSLYHKLTQGSNQKWHRNTSPQRVKEELMSHLRNMPFITHIAINDDNFLIRDIQEMEEIAGFLKNELNKTFTVNATPPFVTEEKIALLVNFGLKGISFGVQSGSERILKDIYKRFVKNEQVLTASKIISKFAGQGLSADYGFILDNPYENEDDWRDSLRLWISLSKPKTLSLYSLEFFPGTELTKRAISDGYLKSASSEFNKDYRRDIKYSYANSLFFLNMIAIPKWLNNLLMSDLMVKSWIGTPTRFVVKNRYPAELFLRAVNKIKYLLKKTKNPQFRMILKLKTFLVKTRRFFGFDFLMRKFNDWYERRLNTHSNQELIKSKIMPGWSVVVVTDGKSPSLLENLLKSIDSELNGSSSEIIMVGPKNIRLSYAPKIELKHIVYKELCWWSPGWITFKKNIGARASKYDKIIICHDYIHFEPGWKNGFDKFGDNFDVCVNKIVNLDGIRNRDWITWDYPAIGVGLLPYHAECTRYQIISGAYFVIKRKFFMYNLLDEKLRWGEGEDVEWSKRIRNKTTFKFNPNSVVSFSKMKKSLPNNWQEGTRLLEKEFPAPKMRN